MTSGASSADPATAAEISTWSPFRHTIFSVVWTATVVSNIGGWMYAAAAGWLMTSLTTDPWLVSLVQVASNLPVLLFAFPAGALSDVIDKRKFLMVAESATTVVSTLLAFLVWRGLVGPQALLVFVFIIGLAGALTAPPWQAVVPDLVPKEHLAAALALNSAGINVSRALGSALSGVLIATCGISAPFWANGVSNAGVIGALAWWRPPQRPPGHLPSERLYGAMRVGYRHAANNPRLGATLVRAAAFFVFASAYWALLPLVARQQLAGGPELYGLLLGAIGIGALIGAMQLRRIRALIGIDRTVLAGSLGTVLIIALYALARGPAVALAASLIGGASWVLVLASMNLSAQLALPDWVRGRGLALYVTVFYGAMTLGSALWGQIAREFGLANSLWIAAIGLLLGIPATWRWKLQHGKAMDLTPSLHWPTPVALLNPQPEDAPVMVTVEYHVAEGNRASFLSAMDQLSYERKRDGAYAWAIYRDSEHAGRYLETFYLESWTEHLRQHQRVTKADRALQAEIRRLTLNDPGVTHYIVPSTADRQP
jgi:predicted MFS family arabinose efflux permease